MSANNTQNQTSIATLSQTVNDAIKTYLEKMSGHQVADLYELVMNEVEVPLLKTIMEETAGNQSKAAKMLGLSRGTLRKKLKFYDLV